MKSSSPIELSSADLADVTGGRGAPAGPITNPWNPGFYTQWLGGGGGTIRAPLSGNVKTGPQYYCMPGSTCNFTIAPPKRGK